MSLRNTKQTYGSAAKTFHWLLALLIIGMLAVGLRMMDLPLGPDKFKIYGLHKSFGITILTLATLRLIWKFVNVSPLLPGTMAGWEKLAAKVGHWSLYALMFAMPLSGWGMSSAAGLPVSVFGWFTLPDLVAPDKTLKTELRELHGTLAWVLVGIIVLHVLAAFLHHFYYKDNVLRRMLPFTGEKKYAQGSDTATGC